MSILQWRGLSIVFIWTPCKPAVATLWASDAPSYRTKTHPGKEVLHRKGRAPPYGTPRSVVNGRAHARRQQTATKVDGDRAPAPSHTRGTSRANPRGIRFKEWRRRRRSAPRCAGWCMHRARGGKRMPTRAAMYVRRRQLEFACDATRASFVRPGPVRRQERPSTAQLHAMQALRTPRSSSTIPPSQ